MRALAAVLIASSLLSQAPASPPNPPTKETEWLEFGNTPPGPERLAKTFGWTKASLYMARSSQRPFRIFLNPEQTDTAPQGLYLPQWVQVYPTPENYKWQETKWLIQGSEVIEDGDIIVFYLIREDANKRPGYLMWQPFDQWMCVYNKKTTRVKAMRWALYDNAGEPLEIKDYSPDGIDLDGKGPEWPSIKAWVAAEPAKERARIKEMMSGNKNRKTVSPP